MQLSKRPENITFSELLSIIETKKTGQRDRCLYSLRQCLRIKDLSGAPVGSLLNQDGSVSSVFVSAVDGQRFDLPQQTQKEVKAYLCSRFGVRSLIDLTAAMRSEPLMSNQKRRGRFSDNTMAQHLSSLDKFLFAEIRSRQEATNAQSQGGEYQQDPSDVPRAFNRLMTL